MAVISEKVKKRFLSLTSTMDLPAIRREPTPPNLRWFMRNALIRNRDHKHVNDALAIAKKYG